MSKISTLRMCGLLLAVCLQVSAQVAVTTQHNDNSRTGQNLNETILNTSNVNVSSFGKLFFRTVDGQIYGQVLYVPGLTIKGTVRNVVYVATQNNSVYAFDADNPLTSTPLWQVNLGTPMPSTDIAASCVSITPQVGITSTPVIDTAGKTLYVVADTKDTLGHHFKLHALNLISGAEKFGGPVEISGSVPGTGDASSNGSVPFQPLQQYNRPGLLLANGVVYAAFGSNCETIPWHGWIFGYDALTLHQAAIFNDTPNGSSGGIWGGGQGMLADNSGNIYFASGNGTFDANAGGSDYGDSIVKLSTASGLTVSDYFTPWNEAALEARDADIGSGGPIALPGTDMIANIGKDERMRLVSLSSMGEFSATLDGDMQEFQATANPWAFVGAPVYWSSPNNGPSIYVWGPGDYLKAYQFTGEKFVISPVSESSIMSPGGNSNTVPLSVSADGSTASTGIIWAASSLSGDAGQHTIAGILRAFDATDLSNELWDSQQNAARDGVGNYAKFNPPTIANGKVYVGTFSGQLLAYGLNPPSATGINFIQANSVTPQSAVASAAVSFLNPETKGHLNIVVVGWKDITSTIQSIVDSAGNVYSIAAPQLSNGNNSANFVSQAIYYAPNITGGSNTVTVTFNQPASSPDIRIAEYKSSTVLDVSAGATGNGTVANSGTATTTALNELIFAADMMRTNTLNPGNNFNTRLSTPDNNIAEDRVVNVAGTYSATANLQSSSRWIMQMVTFRTPPVPALTSVSPNSGPTTGGTHVTITGNYFAAGATVTIGGVAATKVIIVSATSITCTTPAHAAAGAVNVVVANPTGVSGTLTGGFTY